MRCFVLPWACALILPEFLILPLLLLCHILLLRSLLMTFFFQGLRGKIFFCSFTDGDILFSLKNLVSKVLSRIFLLCCLWCWLVDLFPIYYLGIFIIRYTHVMVDVWVRFDCLMCLLLLLLFSTAWKHIWLYSLIL